MCVCGVLFRSCHYTPPEHVCGGERDNDGPSGEQIY